MRYEARWRAGRSWSRRRTQDTYTPSSIAAQQECVMLASAERQ